MGFRKVKLNVLLHSGIHPGVQLFFNRSISLTNRDLNDTICTLLSNLEQTFERGEKVHWYMFWYSAITANQIAVLSLAALLGIVIPFWISKQKDGLYFCVAWSSRVGGACEFLVLTFSLYYLHGKPEPIWLQAHELLVSTVVIGAAVALAMIWFLGVRRADGWKSGRTFEEYHNIMVVFLVMCFVLPSLVLSATEAIANWPNDLAILTAMIVLLVVYLSTVAVDKFGPFKGSEQAESLFLSGGLARFIRILVPVVQRLGERAEKNELSTFRPWWGNVTNEMFYDALAVLIRDLENASSILRRIQTKRKG
jgi:hypothetical protein